MFISMAVIMMLVGILLLIKAVKMPRGKGINIVSICAVGLVILGALLCYGVLSGKIGLPLY